jgi:hypothetical protein
VTVNVTVDDGGSATRGADFSGAPTTLTFGPGVTSQTFDLGAVDDGLAEGTETIVLRLESPSGGATLGTTATMTVFVIDRQQTVALARATYTVGETVPKAAVRIVRSGVPEGTVTVLASTQDGTAVAGRDYVAVTNQMITFLPGQTSATFNVPILTQNASRIDGNRALTVLLSNSTNATLVAPATATLTILDFRPDLIIASVAVPSRTLNDKRVQTPSMVENIGQVPAPAFTVGIFMQRADAPDASTPGAGTLMATQPVAGLAAGASSTFPTQLKLDEDFPPGDYYVSAVANFAHSFTEADASNNGRSSAPAKLTVSRNLTGSK